MHCLKNGRIMNVVRLDVVGVIRFSMAKFVFYLTAKIWYINIVYNVDIEH